MKDTYITDHTPHSIIQVRSWRQRKLSFDDQELEVDNWHWLLGKRIRRFRLDEINPRYEVRSVNITPLDLVLIITGGLFLLSIAVMDFYLLPSSLLYFILCLAVLATLKLFMNQRVIEFKTRDEPIRIYSNRMSNVDVEDFVEALVHQIKSFFLEKYGYTDPDLPTQKQFENYRWLLQNNFITPAQYEDLKLKLKVLVQAPKGSK